MKGVILMRIRTLTVLGLVAGGVLIYSPASPLTETTRQAAQKTVATKLQEAGAWVKQTSASFKLPQAPTHRSEPPLTHQPAANQVQPAQQNQAPQANSTGSQTPVFDIAVSAPLSAHYTYDYADGLPANARQAFEAAVTVYQATGLVTLEPGPAVAGQNHVTFGSYAQPSASAAMELGHGGPQITTRYGWTRSAVNQASAALNLAYGAQAATASVAIHELGHALGLDHSQSRDSVMYPVDQGVIRLSVADLAGLRQIYGRNS